MDKAQLQEQRHKFYFEDPLYEEVRIEGVEDLLILLKGEVDAYNSISGIDTTYTISNDLINE